jgi:photosystem II stability/assembly factor-like uncharacterized protein
MRRLNRLCQLLPLLTRFSLAAVVLLGILGPIAPLAAQTWTPLGPEGGIVDVFALAPSNAQAVYAGMLGGGVYRSGDGGKSWSAASGGLGNLTVRALVVDPQNASVVYAGTDGGFYKTVTAGAGWTRFGPGLDPGTPPILALALDPQIPSRLYAGTYSGLYISRNGGRRWVLAGGGLPAKAAIGAIAIGSDGTILAGLTGKLGLFKSTDGGVTWSDKSAGLHAGTLSTFTSLVADPSTPGIFYAVIDGTAFRSVDDGETFDPLPALPEFTVSGFAVAPSGTLYASTSKRGVLVSTDHGMSFNRVVPPTSGAISPAFVATAVATLPAVPDGTLLAGNEGRGVLRLPAGAGAWQNASHGLLASVITSLSLDPRNPATLYAGTVGEGLQKSLDGGASWHDSSAGLVSLHLPFTVTAVAVDPQNPARVYVGVEGSGLARSDDSGAHFTKIADFSDVSGLGLCNTPTLLTFAPGTSTLFLGIDFDFRLCNQYCLALRTSDAGESLQCLNGFSTLDAIAFDPSLPSTGYAASDGLILRSTNSGQTFAPWSQPQIGGSSLLVDPAAPQKLYAGTALGVYRSGDRGLHWALAGPLPSGQVPVLVAEPGTRRIFAGVEGAGVYGSADGGTTWQPLGTGLPPGTFGRSEVIDAQSHILYTGTPASSLVLDVQHHILYAGTSGSGVYKLKL